MKSVVENFKTKKTKLQCLQFDMQHRKKYGQFFTPPTIAEFMVKYGSGAKTMLDPGCGMGIFIDKMLDLGTGCRITGIDIDPEMIRICKSYQKSHANVSLINADYLSISHKMEQVDFLICNPPYINFHNFNRNIISRTNSKFGTEFSKLTNFYALFMVNAKTSVRTGGRIAFITPAEFFYTGYGKILKRFLLENFTIDKFVTFDFDRQVFDDALTTSAITFMVNKKPSKNHNIKFVRIRGGQDALSLTSQGSQAIINKAKQSRINPDDKWQKYFDSEGISNVILKHLVPLKAVADVKRGIATGSNDFFTLSNFQKSDWGIESKFLIPVISKAEQTDGYEITKSVMDNLTKDGNKVHLLYCFGKPSPSLRKYIQHGKTIGINNGYICSHRTPWYSMEKRTPAPILSTVFSRNNMRFIHNKAKCLNLAAYHGIYPHNNNVKSIEALLCYLNSSICRELQVNSRREYGGGLHKFEPSDLLELPVIDVRSIARGDILKMSSLFRKMVKPQGHSVDELDNEITEIVMNL